MNLCRSVFPAAVLWFLSPASGRADSFYCESQGVYTDCVTADGYERCKDVLSNGAGLSPDRGRAEADAIDMCSLHMTKMVGIGNSGIGSAYKSQRSFVKSGCVVVSCKAQAEQPAADPGAYASDEDRLMAEGDRAMNRGDTEGAVQRWEQVIASAPNRPEPYARLAYVQLVNMELEAGCIQIDRGLRAVPQSELLNLGRVECLIYRRQPEAAQEAAGVFMQNSSNPDFQLFANLLGWIAASLSTGGAAPCPRLASTLSQRSELPSWNLNPLSVFLGTYGSAADVVILQGLNALSEGPASAGARFAALCGGGG